MLCLCLYVPVTNSDRVEVEYFESDGLPLELKSLFKLSVLLPSQEFSTYRNWRKVRPDTDYLAYILLILDNNDTYEPREVTFFWKCRLALCACATIMTILGVPPVMNEN